MPLGPSEGTALVEKLAELVLVKTCELAFAVMFPKGFQDDLILNHAFWLLKPLPCRRILQSQCISLGAPVLLLLISLLNFKPFQI